MSTVQMWLSEPGVLIVRRDDGFPMPPVDHEARYTLDPPAPWPWKREDVWPCHFPGWSTCQQLATWRHSGPGPTRGFYCQRHARKPIGGPVQVCSVCTGPMDPVITKEGHNTHPTCEYPPLNVGLTNRKEAR